MYGRVAIGEARGAPLGGISITSNARSVCGVDSSSMGSPRRVAELIRTILPVGPMGSSHACTRVSGHLLGCRRVEQNWRSSLRHGRSAPAFVTTHTPTTSCSVAWGIENAAHCATAWCVTNTSSMSEGVIVSPPRLIVSLERPVTNK